MTVFKHLNRLYRLIGQAFFFALFGIVGVAIGFVLLPVVKLIIRNPVTREKVARSIIGGCFKFFVWLACGMRLISCRVSGLDNVDPDANYLIVANHPTLIDVVIIVSLFPQVDCVVKEAVIRNPALRVSATTANYISNSDPGDLLAECTARLRAGASLMLFPEGTRTVPGRPLRFKPGAAEVALRAESDILPIVIDCRPPILAKHYPWHYIAPRVPHFEIHVLSPLNPADASVARSGGREARRELNSALEALFTAELA